MATCAVAHGVVLLLDVLGVKSYDVDEAKRFADKWESLIDDIDVMSNEIFAIGQIPIVHRKPDRFVFGDTILFVWNIDSYAYDIAGTFCDASYFGARLLEKGIENNILFRGAISTGEYYYVKRKMLLPL